MPDMLRPPERDRLIAYLERNLAQEMQLGDRKAVALRERGTSPLSGDSCWTADAAGALELLALPAVRPRWHGLAEGLTGFLLAMSEDGLLHRRTARPECVVSNIDPLDFHVVTGSHEFSGDLSRGLVRQELRGQPAGGREVLHTGHLVEFRIGRRSHCLDVEDTIRRYGLVPQPDGVALFHESELRAPHGLLRREGVVATLRYEYTIRAGDPRLLLRVTLKAAPGVTLEGVRLTTALDELSGGPPERPITRIVLGEGGGLRPLSMQAEALANLHLGPAETLSLVEEAPPGAAMGVHIGMPSGARLRSIKLATRESGGASRPHWLLSRYELSELGGGQGFTVEEHRLVTAGTLAGAEAAYARLLADPAPLAGGDAGLSPDYGAALNAIAAQIHFSASGAYGTQALAPERLAELRGWYDRHLLALFAAMADAPPEGAPPAALLPGRVALRSLAFTLLSLDLMLHTPRLPPATGAAPDYAALLRLGLQALLARQEAAEDGGAFTEAVGETMLDGHAAALLALARLALRRRDLPGEEIAAALRRGLMALRLGPPLHGGEARAQEHPLLQIRRADGTRLADDGFWSFKLGLLMRAANVLGLADRAGAVPLEPGQREHLQALFDACFRLLRGRVRVSGSELEVLPTPIATEGHAGTQAPVLLALLSPDETVLEGPAPAQSLAS
ncbi:hypothetical protein [Roseomonas marmotae]|uniref:Uncharacterized protein n=1 Tax=Roseomonas marmotae TaxID=2768161 RepID=A0ABS3KDQ3_9PROT|nr:hypothetical protein [Roseomonas marmotae]MBO1075594.1 hypothetical protein [Roseomonas marmotae]QTI79456.1 hypothetical protein IAI58_01120 [Roseomonas marmotae]